MNPKFWKRMRVKGESSVMDKIIVIAAEFFGTTILLFVGCLGSTAHQGNNLLYSSLSFGLGVMIAMQCVGHISGAHVNPILSIAAVLTGILPLIDGLLYIVAQIIGALCGFGLIRLLVSKEAIFGVTLYREVGSCSVFLDEYVSEVKGLFLEFFISFILILVFCATSDYKNRLKTESTPLRFGLAVSGLMIAAGPYTKGALNPARALAPAVLNDFWRDHWIYWAGDVLGAAIASILYVILFTDESSPLKQQDASGEEAN